MPTPLERPKPLSERLNYERLATPLELRQAAARLEQIGRQDARLDCLRAAKERRREADVREAWLAAGKTLG